jgi:poly(hydroxyalkanoate) depolymerase family esterase
MTTAALLLAPAQASAGTFTYTPGFAQVTDFPTPSTSESNPTNLGMWAYLPAGLPTDSKVPILVAIHYCTGSASDFYHGGGAPFAALADTYKFEIIWPSVNRSGKCFDVATAEALKHDGQSDPRGISSMVQHAIAKLNGDPERVYMMGASSGAMMVNVLAGDYPDLFKAGVAFSGVPFHCFYVAGTTPSATADAPWGNACAAGTLIQTSDAWAALVQAANTPAWTGSWPRLQLWHGATDTTLSYKNLDEEIKQWTTVSGVAHTGTYTDTLAFTDRIATRTRYGSSGPQAKVESISLANTAHELPLDGMAAVAVHFLGLDGTSPDTQPPSAPTDLASSKLTSTGVTLTWTAAADGLGVGVTKYVVFQGASGSSAAPVAVKSVAGITTDITGLTPSTGYVFSVQAQDAVGNVSTASTTVTVTTAGGSVAGGGGGSAGGGGGGTTGDGGGGGGSSSSSSKGCSHGDASGLALALLILGGWSLVRGRREAGGSLRVGTGR